MSRSRNDYGLTHQQELFAQALATGKTQADAYREAYPVSQKWPDKNLWSQASKTAKLPMVQRRVSDLREAQVARVQEHTAYTVEVAMGEAQQALELALATRQPGALVAAIQLRAKLNGLLIERKETGEAGDFAKMDAGRKAEAMRALEEELARRSRLGIAPTPGDVQDVDPK